MSASRRSMRPRANISYAESDFVRQQTQHTPQPAPPQPQPYYNGRLIEKQFSHPAFNKMVFDANAPLHQRPGHFTGQQMVDPNFVQNLTAKPPKPPTKPTQPHVRYAARVWDRIKSERKNAQVS